MKKFKCVKSNNLLFTEGGIYESIAVTPRGTNVVITKDGRVYELTSENFDRSSNWTQFEESKEFTKHDKEKPRFSLIPVAAIDALTSVLEFGAKKYAPDNWKQCEDPTRYFDAAMRHMLAHRRGEFVDPESGLSHFAHALCNMAFLVHFESQGHRDD